MADSDKKDLIGRIHQSIADYNRLFDKDDKADTAQDSPKERPKPEKPGAGAKGGKQIPLRTLLGNAATIPHAAMRKAARRYLDGDRSHVLAAMPAAGPPDSPPMGVENCPHYLGDNRVEWWNVWKDPETAAKIATSPMTNRDAFKCEFHEALRGVVTFDSLSDGQSPNDLPGKQFTILARGNGAPVVRRRNVTHETDSGMRTRDVVSVIVNEDPRGPEAETGETERSVLVIAFDSRQRAVGLDYGFLARDENLPPPPETAVDISTQGVELKAFTRDGQLIVNSHGSDMAGGSASPRWVDRNTVTKRIGVRDSEAQIGYVELHFERRSAHEMAAPGDFITEPQVVYRVWHEPFPTACVLQGEVSRELAAGATENLPFHCDQATAFIRGFKIGFEGVAHDVSTIAFDIETSVQNRQVTLHAGGQLRSSADDAPPDRVKIYYTLVAWDGERAELLAPSGQAELAQYVDEGATSRGLVVVPDPCVLPPLPNGRSATWAELCGPVCAGLSAFRVSFWEETDVDQFGFVSDPAVRTFGDTISWPVHMDMADPEDFNSAVGGQFLTGRSLRLGPDGMPLGTGRATTGGAFPLAVESRGERPADAEHHFYWQGPESITYGFAWPIQAEIAFLSVAQWQAVIHHGLFKGDGPVRDIELELKATNYDGRIAQWTEGGGVSSHDEGEGGDHNSIFGWPSWAGIVPKTAFIRPRLAVQDLRFENGVAGVVSLEPEHMGVLINQGDAPVFVTRGRKTGDDPGSFMVVLAVTRRRVWEGVDLLSEGEARGQILSLEELETGPPLQLLPGEALLIGGRFFPQEQRYHSAWLNLSTSDSQTPTAAIYMEGRVGESQAEWDLAPEHVNFDSVQIGQAKVRRALIVSVGQTPLLITRIRIQDPDNGFTVGGGAEIGGDGGFFQLQPGSSHIVDITFRPNAEGFADSKIIVETNAGSRSAFLHGAGN